MDEDASTLLPNILEVIEDIVEDAGYVFGGTILKPEGFVNEVALEILGANEPYAVEHVGYAVLPQELVVLRHRVATEVHVFRDSRTFLVVER